MLELFGAQLLDLLLLVRHILHKLIWLSRITAELFLAPDLIASCVQCAVQFAEAAELLGLLYALGQGGSIIPQDAR